MTEQEVRVAKRSRGRKPTRSRPRTQLAPFSGDTQALGPDSEVSEKVDASPLSSAEERNRRNTSTAVRKKTAQPSADAVSVHDSPSDKAVTATSTTSTSTTKRKSRSTSTLHRSAPNALQLKGAQDAPLRGTQSRVSALLLSNVLLIIVLSFLSALIALAGSFYLPLWWGGYPLPMTALITGLLNAVIMYGASKAWQKAGWIPLMAWLVMCVVCLLPGPGGSRILLLEIADWRMPFFLITGMAPAVVVRRLFM